jgi:site-specific recombinase XerD
MTDTTKLGPWVRRFLLEHLVEERNPARNTQRSYRDSLALLISFLATKVRKDDQLIVGDITAELLRLFLQDLEQTRGCSVSTRNQRLAMVHALGRFIAEHSPEYIEWGGTIRTIPFKKAMKREITYLEKAEMDALLAAPDRRTAQGQRDYALLLFLYNTGARAVEAAQLTIGNLDLAQAQTRALSSSADPRQR